MVRRLSIASILVSALLLAGAETRPAAAGAQCLVIQQLYGAGGLTGAAYTNDFVVLLNRCSSTVDLTGLTLQHAATTTVPFSVIASPSGTLGAGAYYLIAGAVGGPNGASLPPPDLVATFNFNSTNGKLVLVASSMALTGCPAPGTYVDLVQYGPGTENCFEGTGFTSTVIPPVGAAHRAAQGCQDTDNNNTDFAAAPPDPKNTASPTVSCPSLAVTLRFFTASRSGRTVLVRWRTASERQTLGFHVYRDLAGKRQRINRVLLPSRGGGLYAFLDRRAGDGSARYWLQDVALDGSRTWHGPARSRLR